MMMKNFFSQSVVRHLQAGTHRLPVRSNLFAFFSVAISNAALQHFLEQRVSYNATPRKEITFQKPK